MAGGFLTGADDVVQPYSLPRNLHEVESSPMITQSTPRNNGSTVDLHSVGTSNARPGAEEVIEDSEEEIVEIPKPSHDAVIPLGAPKTMQELAQHIADQSGEVIVVSGDEEMEVELPGQLSVEITSETNGKNRATRDKRGTTTKTTKQLKPATNTSRRVTRKRGRPSNTEGDSSDLEVLDGPSSPRKRRKTKTPTAIVKSDRVLRTRIPKSASKAREEREIEEALERATEE